MGRIKLIKKDSRSYLELPSDFSSDEYVELFQLKPGYYLISVPLGESLGEKQLPDKFNKEIKNQDKNEYARVEKVQISQEEKNLITKLSLIKFEKRIPKYLDKILNPNEKEVLKEIIKKGLINIFTSKKYSEGVYNIKDYVYPMLKSDGKNAEKNTEKSVEVRPIPRDSKDTKPDTSNNVKKLTKDSPMDTLNANGYLVIPNQNEAYSFSEELKKTGREKDVIGIRSFDGMFYIATRRYFSKFSSAIKDLLDGNNAMDVSSLAKNCETAPEGCRTVLHILADKGEVIEKKKDVFVSI